MSSVPACAGMTAIGRISGSSAAYAGRYETAPHPALGLPPAGVRRGRLRLVCGMARPGLRRAQHMPRQHRQRQPRERSPSALLGRELPRLQPARLPARPHLRARQGAQRHARCLRRPRQLAPDLRFVYAETSWPWGGNFAPHKTPCQRHLGRFPRADADGRPGLRAPHLALQPVRLFGGVRRRRPQPARS